MSDTITSVLVQVGTDEWLRWSSVLQLAVLLVGMWALRCFCVAQFMAPGKPRGLPATTTTTTPTCYSGWPLTNDQRTPGKRHWTGKSHRVNMGPVNNDSDGAYDRSCAL